MISHSRLRRLGRICAVAASVLWPTAAWSMEGTVVQQIGDRSGEVAEAVASEVAVVPFSPSIDARTTPIILAPGALFVFQQPRLHAPRWVVGLTRAERKAIRQAYRAGQTIVVFDASSHDIQALHLLLRDGVAHGSDTDPVVLAYALRQENKIPTARVVTYVRPHSPDGPHGLVLGVDDDPEADDRAFMRAIDMVVGELLHVPTVSGDDVAAPTSQDWRDSPVQNATISVPTNGTYNTPVRLYALHSCQADADGKLWDHYVVDTGGDWTPSDDISTNYFSASEQAGQLGVNDAGELVVTWQNRREFCTGGVNIQQVFNPNPDFRICQYRNYPLYYEVDIVPPVGPTVVQLNAAPAGTQGKSESYSSGVTFSIGGSVIVSGSGPSAGVNAGLSWNNSVSSTVPPLVIHAGDIGNQGAFTQYKYCTDGETKDCTSTIQMASEGICADFIVGDPQNGQTANGRLSDVAQTVHWRVDPTTYPSDSTTFDITVTWKTEFATSTSYLWWAKFQNEQEDGRLGPPGYCNIAGCSCGIHSSTTPLTKGRTFRIPHPSTDCGGG